MEKRPPEEPFTALIRAAVAFAAGSPTSSERRISVILVPLRSSYLTSRPPARSTYRTPGWGPGHLSPGLRPGGPDDQRNPVGLSVHHPLVSCLGEKTRNGRLHRLHPFPQLALLKFCLPHLREGLEHNLLDRRLKIAGIAACSAASFPATICRTRSIWSTRQS